MENKTMENFNWKNPIYAPILAKRQKILKNIRNDKSGKFLKALYVYYKDNPAEFINDWGCTFDPRCAVNGGLPTVPFILFPRQIEWINWVHSSWKNQENGLTEKSRDMGISWLAIAYAVYLWIFHKGVVVGFGSRKEEYVDKIGSPKSLFWKARMFIELLPSEFTPVGYNAKKHAPHMRILNPENGSAIVGEGGPSIGRGDRASIYFVDEAAHLENPESIDAALSQTTNCRHDLSSVCGTGNPFYQKRFSGKWNVFTFHWRDDPRKDDNWYQAQKDAYPPHIVAQEIDIDYQASNEGMLIRPEWIRAAIGIDLQPTGMKKAGLDVADEEGVDTNALCIGHGNVIESIEQWNFKTTTETAQIAWGKCKLGDVEMISYDSIGVGAGVRGEFKQLLQKDSSYSPKINPVNVGSTKLPGFYSKNKRNKDMFISLKAKMCWELRDRFEKTYEHVNNIKKHNLDDLIKIPNNSELINELSQPKFEINTVGKITIESKKAMKTRGINSPNLFDALVLYFAKRKTAQML